MLLFKGESLPGWIPSWRTPLPATAYEAFQKGQYQRALQLATTSVKEGSVHLKDVAVDKISNTGAAVGTAAINAKDAAIHGAQTVKTAAGNVADKAMHGAEVLKERGIDLKDTIEDKLDGPQSRIGQVFLHQSLETSAMRCFYIICTVMMAGGLIPHLLFGSSKYGPVVRSTALLTACQFSFLTAGNYGAKQVLASACVALWAVRLCVYAMRKPKTELFMSKKYAAKIAYWAYQSCFTFLLLLPVIVNNANADEGKGYYKIHTRWGNVTIPLPFFLTTTAIRDHIGMYEMAGLGLFLLGFALEIMADRETESARAKDTIAMNGIHRILQYPSYLAKLILWTGIAMISLHGERHEKRWLAFVSPIAMAIHLFIVGSAERKRRLERFKDDKNFKSYNSNTYKVIPYLI